MDDYTKIKFKLHEHCIQFVQQRLDGIRNAIDSAKEAADDETKSSSGDKYETGRSMMQIEIENQMIQLKEAQRLWESIQMIRPGFHSEEANTGSLVVTNLGKFYIAIGAGKILIDKQEYYALAPSSPIGQFLIDKKKGDKFEFNSRKYVVEKVI